VHARVPLALLVETSREKDGLSIDELREQCSMCGDARVAELAPKLFPCDDNADDSATQTRRASPMGTPREATAGASDGARAQDEQLVLGAPIPWYREGVHLRATILELCEQLRRADVLTPKALGGEESGQTMIHVGLGLERPLGRALIESRALELLNTHRLLQFEHAPPPYLGRAGRRAELPIEAEDDGEAADGMVDQTTVRLGRSLDVRFEPYRIAGMRAPGGGADARAGDGDDEAAAAQRRALLLLRDDTFGYGTVLADRAALLRFRRAHAGGPPLAHAAADERAALEALARAPGGDVVEYELSALVDERGPSTELSRPRAQLAALGGQALPLAQLVHRLNIDLADHRLELELDEPHTPGTRAAGGGGPFLVAWPRDPDLLRALAEAVQLETPIVTALLDDGSPGALPFHRVLGSAPAESSRPRGQAHLWARRARSEERRARGTERRIGASRVRGRAAAGNRYSAP
jgi:hypothetical protein